MAARIHAFVQYADDLDDTVLGDAIVRDMNRPLDLPIVSRAARMSDVEAPNTRTRDRLAVVCQPLTYSTPEFDGTCAIGPTVVPANAAKTSVRVRHAVKSAADHVLMYGPYGPTSMSPSGSSNGRLRKTTASTTEKVTVAAAMADVRMSTQNTEEPEAERSERHASRTIIGGERSLRPRYGGVKPPHGSVVTKRSAFFRSA
jgi:hypothetical protein